MRTCIATFLLVLFAVASSAATWHVAKDGSGDFSVIQDAIDAASPGDVIRIHAGRYDDLIEGYDVWGNGTVIADVHVAITKDNLTLQGDDSSTTMIGPAEYPSSPPPNYIGITVTITQANSLTIRNIAVENVRYGMYVACPACNITDCRFEGMNVDGVRLFTSSSCNIDNCDFVNCFTSIVSFYPTANLNITNSLFRLADLGISIGCACVDSDNVSIDNCQFFGGGGAINFQQGTNGVIANVSASQYNTYGVGLSLGGFAQIFDSTFEGGLKAIISEGAGVECEGCSFIGQTYQTVYVSNEGVSSFADCEIINGGGYSVYCDYNGTADCHLDITNCYWGTDDEDQIAAWIWDSNDDPDLCCEVDFVPFQGGVAVDNQTWSEVKGLFRTGDE